MKIVEVAKLPGAQGSFARSTTLGRFVSTQRQADWGSCNKTSAGIPSSETSLRIMPMLRERFHMRSDEANEQAFGRISEAAQVAR